ncbi:hypothetical protein L249_0108 [Ophiocordyceps polyrhachis-furcata BCC 54312]|uniref:Microbial-type PARG catalytic domain-containing protein n=1 Tax=Ophiocordyceps polyrhachis-furcata BCC 54312 TaxID=1330021 RepID=A0A367LDU4_9HYPO|nr:hypothetical protein L249_0108 [Ophiocordyceps polyrhachis-furcata BCC 54312]
MPPASRSGRVRPSDVAAETRRTFIPLINAQHAHEFPPYSVLYRQPTEQLVIRRRVPSTRPPVFRFVAGDPVMAADSYGRSDSRVSEAAGGGRIRVPFICAANERSPGGDWVTGCSGYEEKLCRRSNLFATLSTPDPESGETNNYPIPLAGGILSDSVVVWRGPHDRYDHLDSWYNLPVVSVPPTRWPKLRENGSRYSFPEERKMMRDKMRGALRICLYHEYNRVVIGDFGLGNSWRNPPQEVAEMWRDVLLFDPDLRGQFAYVVFAFEDAQQSTTRMIYNDIARRDRSSGGQSREGGGAAASSSSGSSAAARSDDPTDMSIFQRVFDEAEIERVLSATDPRYDLSMITS